MNEDSKIQGGGEQEQRKRMELKAGTKIRIKEKGGEKSDREAGDGEGASG